MLNVREKFLFILNLFVLQVYCRKSGHCMACKLIGTNLFRTLIATSRLSTTFGSSAFIPRLVTKGQHSKILTLSVWSTRWHHQAADSSVMDLKEVTQVLNSFAPTSLAEGWDNVGLLVEPSPPHSVKSMLLTNDLTEDVMNEAVELKVDMILSYHPPIFSGLKRLTQASWKERIIITCLENRIAVYSPHTSYDAVLGGVNDWLISAFGNLSSSVFKLLINIWGN